MMREKIEKRIEYLMGDLGTDASRGRDVAGDILALTELLKQYPKEEGAKEKAGASYQRVQSGPWATTITHNGTWDAVSGSSCHCRCCGNRPRDLPGQSQC